MIGQPSVNDLASAFRGNPGPLQARVNQEQQGQPPGTLPRDLRDLLALQIVTNEQDAAKRNAAMQQLQQMQPQGPQGEPPTVAQSLQQQAKQKLQARMMQQQQQAPQGIQGLLQLPQPERQPEEEESQGIDTLPSNVGENFAGGGIIAFNGDTEDGSFVVDPMLGTTVDTRMSDDDRTILEKLGIFNPENRRALEAAERELKRERAQPADVRPPAPRVEQEPPAPPATQERQVVPPRAAPPRASLIDAVPPSAAPVAPPAAAPAQPPLSDREKYLGAQITPAPQPEVGEREFETKVGQRSTAGLQAAADELRAQKARIAKRLQENQSFSEYMRQIATAPRGLTSAAAGSYGAEGVRRREQALEDQNLSLLQNILKTEEAIEDVKHGYKKEKYAAGRDAVKTAVDRANKAAELLGYDERQRQELVAKAVEGAAGRQTQIDVAKIQAAAQRAGYMKPSEAERVGAEYRRILKEQGQKAADDFLESEQRVRAAVGGVKYEGQDRDVANSAKVYEILNKDDAYKMERDVIRRLEAKEKRTPKEEQRLAAARRYVQNEYNRVSQGLYGTGAGAAGEAGGATPMPTSQAELQNGVVYQTSRGPARWDAATKQFFPVK